MDFWTIVGLMLAVISIILGVPGFIIVLGDRVSFLKKANYFLTNKKFKSKISATRKYPYFSPEMRGIKEKIDLNFKNKSEKIDFQNRGSNYIQLLLKDMQAPYFIKFMPEPDHHSERRTIVQIKLLGTLNFRYREDLDNKKYLRDIEELFRIIESTHQIIPSFEDYNLISTFSEFKETSPKNKKIKNESSIVNIGEHVLNIHSTSLNHVYDVNKKHLTDISVM